MLEYFFYRLGEFIALSLPLKAAYRLAISLSNIHYWFAFKDREVIAENLSVIFPEKSNKEIRVLRKSVFHNFAKYLTDFLRFKKLNLEYIRKNVRLVNLSYIHEALNKGKGVILVTAHLGNWELGGVVLSMLDFPISSVALPHKSAKVDSFFNSQRESKGLRDKRIIALVGDRDFIGSGSAIDFFNRPAVFPEGPAVFSLKTGAVIMPGFMLRNDDDSFSLIIEKPLVYSVTGDAKTDVASVMGSYRKVFEGYIKKYPDQWYMFRRFWKE